MGDSPTIKEFVSQAEIRKTKTRLSFFIHAALTRHKDELTKNV